MSNSTLFNRSVSTYDIVMSDPAYPGEHGERLEKVTWDEVPGSGTEETDGEKTFTAYTTAVSNTSVNLRVQRVEQSAGHQVCGPDWERK